MTDPILQEPYIDDTLLLYLETVIKDVAPEIDHSDREIWFNRGRVEVLRHLRRLHQVQRENMLGGNHVS